MVETNGLRELREAACTDYMRDVGTWVGPKDRLAQDVTLNEKEFVSKKGQHSGLLLLELTLGEDAEASLGRTNFQQRKIARLSPLMFVIPKRD